MVRIEKRDRKAEAMGHSFQKAKGLALAALTAIFVLKQQNVRSFRMRHYTVVKGMASVTTDRPLSSSKLFAASSAAAAPSVGSAMIPLDQDPSTKPFNPGPSEIYILVLLLFR